ncbi:hypothetical protein ACIBG0_28160 [Nocardia sp. NPDC050630]|uniref:hypothetical protein n=1 Tax=Nocardia sp. NPDC050630 TaxID=3364321 RepID=UPI00379709CF
MSGNFLIIIGLLNRASLLGIWRVFRWMRQGDFDEARLERGWTAGPLNRVLAPVVRLVEEPSSLAERPCREVAIPGGSQHVSTGVFMPGAPTFAFLAGWAACCLGARCGVGSPAP